ncbi:MAG TPA: aminopeptidase [Solirubrobacteraceae bacterium]
MISATGFDPATLARFADLLVGFGANVQPGQIVSIGAEIGKEEIARALAASAYRHGAKFADVTYFDLHVKHARLLHAREDTLEFVPSWYGERILALGDQRCARIGLSGPIAPGLLDDIDPERAGRDQLPFLKESGKVVNDATTNWTIGPAPSLPWARLVHPDLPDEEALTRLAGQLEVICRLDEADPVAAWTARADTLVAAAERVTAPRFDALRFVGPGTDLTVGLLPTSRFMAARFETVDGIVHMPNIPSEEIFTSPDPLRTEGVVRSTKPLVVGGSIIRGLEVEFRAGRVVRIDADENAEVLRGYTAKDEGAARLGEVALVDREGRIGQSGTVFFDTLLDENAASHIALGSAYAMCLDGDADRERINKSQIHVDFMIGSEDVTVSGITADGAAVPVLAGGDWAL